MEDTYFDFISIGAGPAGLSAAQYSARASLKTLLLDTGVPGGQVTNIAHLENYPGVFPAIDGFSFIDAMQKQAETFGAKILQTEVLSVTKNNELFTVKTEKGAFTAATVLIATGAEHRKLGVKGELDFTGRGVSYCATCDGPFFRKKHVVVVGGGDSACDEAMYLATLCNKVTVVHRKSEFRAQKAVANRVLSKANIEVRFNTVVQEILGDKTVSSVELLNTQSNSLESLEASGVFIFIGLNPRTSLFSELKKDSAGYIITNENMETSVEGLYAAGDVRSKSFRQIVTATADGAIASHSAYAYIQKLRGKEYK